MCAVLLISDTIQITANYSGVLSIDEKLWQGLRAVLLPGGSGDRVRAGWEVEVAQSEGADVEHDHPAAGVTLDVLRGEVRFDEGGGAILGGGVVCKEIEGGGNQGTG